MGLHRGWRKGVTESDAAPAVTADDLGERPDEMGCEAPMEVAELHCCG